MTETNENTNMEVKSGSVAIGTQASLVVATTSQEEGNSTKVRDVAALH